MYVINEEGILEMQMKHMLEPNLSSSPDDFSSKKTPSAISPLEWRKHIESFFNSKLLVFIRYADIS